MILKGKTIAQTILDEIKSDVTIYRKKNKDAPPPQLVVFSINPDEATLAFLRNKKKAVEYIGGTFKLLRFGKNQRFEELANKLSEIAQDASNHAIIIQQPLPASLSTMTIFDFVPLEKEIEGYKLKTPFENPLSLAVLTMLKATYQPEAQKDYASVFVDLKKDATTLKNLLRKKKIVLIGRGRTGGRPTAEMLLKLHIPFVNLNSKTVSPEQFLREADIIISAVGKPVIESSFVRDGAVLISVGLRPDGASWAGDYIDAEVQGKVLAFTPTPGGVGPVTVAYLVSNLVAAWKMQCDAA